MTNYHGTKHSDLALMAFQKPCSSIDALATPKTHRKPNDPSNEDELTREWDIYFSAKMRVAMSNHLKDQYNSYRMRTTSLQSVYPDKTARSPTKSLSKTRTTFTSTLHNLNFQSSSTLQHSEVSVGFTKAKRFKDPPVVNNGGFTYLEIPNTLSTRSCGFGLGTKSGFSTEKLRDARRTPAPNNYSVKSSTDLILQKRKIPTIGSPRTAYLRVYYPECHIPDPRLTAHQPGPGAYFTESDFEKKCRITLKSKGRMFNELSEQSPACNLYSPEQTPVQSARYKGISFGLGTRSDFTKLTTKSPGPAAYDLPTSFNTPRKPLKRSASQAAL